MKLGRPALPEGGPGWFHPGMPESMTTIGSLPPILVPQHNLARYRRVRLEVTDGVFRWDEPRTVLGIIPVGRRAGRWATSLLAVAAAVVGFLLLPWWLAVPLLLVALWVLVVSTGPYLEARTLSGGRRRVAVCFGHKIDAELFMAGLADIVSEARSS